jgi:hypothetical protein
MKTRQCDEKDALIIHLKAKFGTLDEDIAAVRAKNIFTESTFEISPGQFVPLKVCCL